MTDSFLPEPIDPQQPAPAAPQEPKRLDIFGVMARRRREQSERAFMSSFTAGLAENPDMRAEAQQLSKKLTETTGKPVSVDVVTRDIKWARQLQARQDAKLWFEAQRSPTLQAKLTDPEFAAIAWDDLDNLTMLENISGNWHAGKLTVERGRIGVRMMRGTATQQDHDRRVAIDKLLHEELPSADSWIGGPFRMFGMMSETIPKALALGAATGSVAIVAGQAGPQAAFPEEVVTVPAAFGFGFASGVAIQAFEIEGGNAFVDYVDGGLDRTRAAAAARVVGAVNAAFETAGFGAIAAPARKFIRNRIRQFAGDRLKRMTSGEATKIALGGLAAAVTGETVTEVAQEMVTMFGEENARQGTETLTSKIRGGFTGTINTAGGGNVTIGDDGGVTVDAAAFERMFGHPVEGDTKLTGEAHREFVENFDMVFKPESAIARGEVMENLVDIALQTVKGVWLPGVIGPAIRLIGDRDRIDYAKRMDRVLELAMTNVAESKVAARNGDVYAQHIASQLEDTAAKEIYISKARFLQKMQDGDYSMELLEREAPDLAKQLRESSDVNEDVVVQTSDWLALKLSELDLGQALREDLRVGGKDALSTLEAVQVEKKLGDNLKDLVTEVEKKEIKDKQVRDELSAIETRIRNEINATGVRISSEQARIGAGLHRRIIEGLALRARVTPAQFESQFGQMQIVRGRDGAASAQTLSQLSSLSREEFLGTPKITAPANARDLKPSAIKSLDDVDAVPFLRDGMTAKFHENGSAVFDESGEVIASYDFGSTLVVAKKHRRQGIAEELVYQWRTRYPGPAKAGERTRAAQKVQEKVFDRVQREASAFRQDEQRGSFDPTDFITKLYDNADASTFFHEAAHYYLEALLNVARSGNAPRDILSDLDALAKWGGMGGWEDLANSSLEERRKLHEMWAYGFENYLHTGKPLSADRTLLGTFRRVRKWLTQVYKDITRTPDAGFRKEFGEELPQISDEVRAVMDRLVETQEAIDYAKKVRAVEAVFEIAEDLSVLQVVPPDQRERLRELLFDADMEADEKLGAVMMRQLRYMKNFRGKFMKEVQAKYRAKRKEIHDEVTEELRLEPVHRAQHFMATGEWLGPNGEVIEDGVAGKVRRKGAHIDILAEMFGYDSGQALNEDLNNAQSLEDAVNDETDQRMAVEHEDITDPFVIEERLIEAMSGPTFQKLIAEQLRFFDKGLPNGRVLRAAAREVALRTIGDRKVGDLRPMTYSLAAGRAQREASRKRREGDIPGYLAELRRALFQNALAEAATQARADIAKGQRNLNKRFLRTDKKLAEQQRIPAFVTAGRIILSRFGLVNPPPESIDNPGYDPFAPLEEDDPTRIELQQTVDEETTGAQDFRKLTVDELADLFQLADSLWFRSKRDKQILLDGERADLEETIAQMLSKLSEHNAKDRAITGSLSKKEKRGKGIRARLAEFRRMEFALQALDRGTPGGIFTRAIWRRAKDAANLMRLDEKRYLTKLQGLVDTLDLTGGTIVAKGLSLEGGGKDHVFGNGEVSGKAELIMALLHSGNLSNLYKLVGGYKWGEFSEDGKSVDHSRWFQFLNQQIDEGVLTRKDMDVVQAIWNLNEELKPLSQKAHYEVAGYRFNEIQTQPLSFVFPDGGLVTYKGGYVPAATDRDQVVDARLNSMDDLLNFQKKLPMVPRGHTKNRAALYARQLDLNPMRLAEHVHSVLLFSHLAPAVKDIRRITEHRDFKDAIDKVDSNFREEILTPWIEALASQNTTKSGKDTWGWLNRFRARAGQAVMFFNVKNALQNYSGIPLALTVVDGRNLRAGLGEVMRDREGAMQRVMKQSNYMKDRFENADIYEVRDRFQGLVIDRGKPGDVQAWFQKNAYWLQRLTQEPIDVAVWLAAYNKAIQDQGMVEGDAVHNEAVQRADAAVRQTQTANNPEDLSVAERGSAMMKLFLQFRGWFISFGNLIRNQAEIRNQRDDRVASLASLYMIGVFAPLISAEIIDALVDGDEIDRDEDGAVWDDLTWRALQSHTSAIGGAIPIWGDAGLVAFSTLFDRQSWTSRMPEPATFSAIRQGLVALRNGDLADGRKSRSVLTFLSVMLGVPINKLLGPPISLYELGTGQADPEGHFGPIFEIPRALVTGKTQRVR